MGDNFYGCGFFEEPDFDKLEGFDERIGVFAYKHNHCDFWYLALNGNGWECYAEPLHGAFSGHDYVDRKYSFHGTTRKRVEIIQNVFGEINESYANSGIDSIRYRLEELYLYCSLADVLKQDFIFASTDDESLDVSGTFNRGELGNFGWRDETLSVLLKGDDLVISPVMTEENMTGFDDDTDTPVWDMQSEPVTLAHHVAQQCGGVVGAAIDLDMKAFFSDEFLSTMHAGIRKKIGGFSSEILPTDDLLRETQKLRGASR